MSNKFKFDTNEEAIKFIFLRYKDDIKNRGLNSKNPFIFNTINKVLENLEKDILEVFKDD